MSKAIQKSEPQGVWRNFVKLNAIPRPSGHVEKVREFLLDFGKSLNLETLKDSTGNVIIKKPATSGMENRKTVVLQGHMDMVAQKNNGIDHDFLKDGIEMYIDGDWIRARGTTLGADNGLGVSAILAILESDTLKHPEIEALITYDEETGLDGAINLDDDVLEGEILLNLDTEEDDEIDIGCAGGIDVTGTQSYTPQKPEADGIAQVLKISGLNGGHSGMDIHKGLGNANKLINRVLYAGSKKGKLQISSIHGGGLRNAIPRESEVHFVVRKEDFEVFKEALEEEIAHVKEEYKSLEKNLKFTIENADLPKEVLPSEINHALLNTIYAIPNGVYRMSPDIEYLVETSNNLAAVEMGDGKIELQCLTRSSVESGKRDLLNAITGVLELGGFEISTAADYPGWQPNPDSTILRVLEKIYTNQNSDQPKVVACHAGLECGILLDHYPHMDAISFGPTIKGAHSPDERASISSTQKFWKLLIGVLEAIPEKE